MPAARRVRCCKASVGRQPHDSQRSPHTERARHARRRSSLLAADLDDLRHLAAGRRAGIRLVRPAARGFSAPTQHRRHSLRPPQAESHSCSAATAEAYIGPAHAGTGDAVARSVSRDSQTSSVAAARCCRDGQSRPPGGRGCGRSPADAILRDFKSYASRALNDRFGRRERWWT